MRHGIVLLLTALLAAATARADAIRYDQIPADVMGYAYLDIDHFLSSRLCQQSDDAMHRAKSNPIFGQEVTVYGWKSEDSGGDVLLIHIRDPKVRQNAETTVAGAKNAVMFTYEKQEIHYTALGMSSIFDWSDDMLSPDDVPPSPAKEDQAKKPHGMFTIGLPGGDGLTASNFEHGPSYTAFIGQDLIVVAWDLPSMAHALDVIQGRKPSLAKEDPRNLKVNTPPGVIFMGAGATASFTKYNTDAQDNHPAGAPGSATQPAKDSDFGGGFGLDMFGSFKAKAKIAHFDVGEDEQSEYINATFEMIDLDSAEQLKNLIIGAKAFFSLSQANLKPLVAPLEIQAAGKNVTLHWSWPAAKLPELLRLAQQAQGDHESSLPTTAPATRPTH